MKDQDYFVISVSPDGIHIQQTNEASIVRDMETGEYDHKEVLDKIADNDPNYWGTGSKKEAACIIIKGSIVTPQPVEKVIKYELKDTP